MLETDDRERGQAALHVMQLETLGVAPPDSYRPLPASLLGWLAEQRQRAVVDR